MFDHTQVISRLSEDQKIRMLTDIHSLADPGLTALGVPQMACETALTGSGGEYPSSAHLACSWDKALLADVGEARCLDLYHRGIRHVFLPGTDVGMTRFDDALSEDPHLTGELAGAFLTGAVRIGMSASLDGYGMTSVGDDCVRELTAVRARKTFLDEPCLRALRARGDVGLVVRAEAPVTLAECPEALLCRATDGRETVRAILAGRICISGSTVGLQKALQRVRRLKADIQHGRATTGELEAACAEGEAISEDALNEGVARLLSFAQRCQSGNVRVPDMNSYPEETAYRAALASTVLLENRCVPKSKRPLLPLTAPRKICFVGDVKGLSGHTLAATAKTLTAAGHTILGHAPGYDLENERDDGMLIRATELIKKSDTVVLLLGTDKERENAMKKAGTGYLPANQLALCDTLSRMDKTVIAVISSRIYPDMSFVASAVHPFAAVLLAPLYAAKGLQAVADILTGAQSPQGRLPVSLIAAASCPDIFQAPRRIGPFVGYRYYDTIGCGVQYPFGGGLTYTTFRYGNLRVGRNEVSFSVRNTGKRAGVEIAQVYLGLANSAVLRPRKELIGFARLELDPGRETTVTLPLEIPPVRTEEGGTAIEAGRYTLFVGSSVTDIHLKTTLVLGQDTLLPDGEDPADYLPSASNVHSKRYVMEAEYTPMKSSYRNLLFGIIALCLAVSVKLYDILTASDSLFLTVVAGVLAVCAAVCFALDILDRRKQNMRERAERENETGVLFENAKLIPVPSAEELFSVGSDQSDRVEEADVSEDEEYVAMADVDKDLTFAKAAKELVILAREKGLLLDEHTVHSMFAALATSRLVMVSGMSDDHFAGLVALLGEYFGGVATLDRVDAGYCKEADVLFTTDSTGLRTARNVMDALLKSRQDRGTLHFAAFSQVDPGNMLDYFVPFVRHAHAPRNLNTVTANNVDGEPEHFVLAENLWLLVQLKDGATLKELPAFVGEVATVHAWNVERITPVATLSHFHRFSYGQMEYLSDRLRESSSIDEEIWKKVDSLETYAARLGDFRMSNKLWLRLELYMAALVHLGKPESAALDEAMAVKLMPALIPALSKCGSHEERSLSETMDVLFGDGTTVLCRQTIKNSGADRI